jgi:predicted aconitase with swiveling domain
MEKIILKGHKGLGGVAEGEALVCQEPINLMADAGNVWYDPKDVTFTNKVATPSVYGQSFANKVLVFPTVNVRAHQVFASIALAIDIPIVDRLDQNPCEVIETGDWVRVDAPKGIVEVTKKG